MLPPARRLPQVRGLIEREEYFVVHAPRQSGKTTALRTLTAELTSEGRFAALLFSCEGGESAAGDMVHAQQWILSEIRNRAIHDLPSELQPPDPWPPSAPPSTLRDSLAAWARACPRPLVLVFDEIDALRDQSLTAVLRQLRAGYGDRPRGFPSSVVLCGLRDVRDYKFRAGDDDRMGTSSPFNIKVESLTLHDFTRDEIAQLVGQHRADTGQTFTEAAIERVFDLTQGQPWLVNALAARIIDQIVTDRRIPVSSTHVDAAKEILIEREDTHLDSLAERLRDPRVRGIIEPMLAGGTPADLPKDDVRFVLDLGLLRRNPDGRIEVANPIYREVIVHDPSAAEPQPSSRFRRAAIGSGAHR